MNEINSGRVLATLGPGKVILNDYVLAVEDIPGGHRLSITQGTKVQTMDILDGQDGEGGVPNGGMQDQLLVKISDANGDAQWQDLFDDAEILGAMQALGALPVLQDADGAILVDGDGKMIMI